MPPRMQAGRTTSVRGHCRLFLVQVLDDTMNYFVCRTRDEFRRIQKQVQAQNKKMERNLYNFWCIIIKLQKKTKSSRECFYSTDFFFLLRNARVTHTNTWNEFLILFCISFPSTSADRRFASAAVGASSSSALLVLLDGGAKTWNKKS